MRIDRRPEAGAEERVVEVLADDGVVAPQMPKTYMPPAISLLASSAPPAIGAVPVAVEAPEREHCLERLRVEFLHANAAEERQWQAR
jgi:hypothetical protein